MRRSLLEPWRSRLLWLSLGVNLFALPLLAAPHVWHRRPPPGPPSFGAVIERLAAPLPPADADRFRAQMAHEQPWYDITRKRLDEARDRTAAAVLRQPYDAEAVRAALAEMRDRMHESSGRFDDSLVAALATISPEARLAMVDTFRRRGRPR